MIESYKCVICDGCHDALDYYQGTISDANRIAKKDGWIVSKNKHYCSKECLLNPPKE